MTAHHVSHLVRDEGAHFLIVEHLQRGGVQDDEGIIHPVCPGVEDRSLGDEQLGNPGPVEGGAHLDVGAVQRGELGGTRLDRVGLEQEANAPLSAQECHDLADRFVETGNRPHGLERGAIGRVLPGDGGNFGKGTPRPGAWNRGAHRRLVRSEESDPTS